MLTVIPSINCSHKDFDCVVEKVRKAEEMFAKVITAGLVTEGRIHLDIADGGFTFGKSWNSPSEWRSVRTPLSFEVHLMVEHPEGAVDEWLAIGAKRVIVHVETITKNSLAEIVKKAQERKADVMLAINPETPLAAVDPYLKTVTHFQVFSQAYPGPSGQPFLPAVLSKIGRLRELLPNATIEVDGGIDLVTARLVKDAGADTVVAGTYTLGSSDPKKAYEELCGI